jgi:hypothetical protein
MSGELSPMVLYYTFFVFSLTGIIFTIIYLSTLSPKVVSQSNITSYFGWLIFGIITVLVMYKIYENNISNNINLIVALYVLYASTSIFNLMYFYKKMIDGESFNNNAINNYRMVIGILNIVIFVLFSLSVYKDNNTVTGSFTTSGKLIIGNIALTFMYLVCIGSSIYFLYVTTSSMQTYSVTDG